MRTERVKKKIEASRKFFRVRDAKVKKIEFLVCEEEEKKTIKIKEL